MGFKIREVFNKIKKHLIVYLIFWIILGILLVMPLSYSYVNATQNGSLDLNVFIDAFGNSITKPLQVIQITFYEAYIGNFIRTFTIYTIAYLIIIIVGAAKSGKGGEFKDIEHGSSDWAENGEQYKILSNKQGIILAEKNYLPVDKRGNVNVLIVGRIRFW